MEDRIWQLPQFVCEGIPPAELRKKWTEFKESFMFILGAIDNQYSPERWQNIFLAVAGIQLQRIYKTLPEPEPGTCPFKDTIEKLDNYFSPKRHDAYERHEFWNMKMEPGENLGKFMLRVQTKANKCQFGTSEVTARDVAVMDKIISSAPADIRKKILEKKDLNVDKLTRIVNSHLLVADQNKEMNTSSINASRSLNESLLNQTSLVNNVDSTDSDQVNRVGRFYSNSERKRGKCDKCGLSSHGQGQHCPAKIRKCFNCDRVGHFANLCRLPKNSDKQPYSYSNDKRRRVNAISCDSEDKDEFINSIGNHEEYIWCHLGGILTKMLIDSGSRYNIIDNKTYDCLKANNAKLTNEGPSDKKLTAYGQSNPLKIVCAFQAEVKIIDIDKVHTVVGDFFVVMNGRQTLLGCESALKLGVLRIGMPSQLYENNDIARIVRKRHSIYY